MSKKSFGSNFLEVVAWLFLASGFFNLLGVLFKADGADLGLGLFNSVLGALVLRNRLKQLISKLK